MLKELVFQGLVTWVSTSSIKQVRVFLKIKENYDFNNPNDAENEYLERLNNAFVSCDSMCGRSFHMKGNLSSHFFNA